MTRAFVQSIERFVAEHRIPMVQFLKGQRKEDVAAQMRARHPVTDGGVFVRKAQEKCTVYRTEKRHNPKTQRAYAGQSLLLLLPRRDLRSVLPEVLFSA